MELDHSKKIEKLRSSKEEVAKANGISVTYHAGIERGEEKSYLCSYREYLYFFKSEII